MKELEGLRNFSKGKSTPAVAVFALMSMLLAPFVSLTCFGAWSDLPTNLHAVMPILHNEAANSSAANVLLMNSCEAAFRNLYRDSHWTTDEIARYWDRISATCTQKWGSTTNVLYLMVVATIGREGEAAWWPWNLIVTQDRTSYSISMSDSIVGLSRAFQGRVYSTMDGLVRLPEAINVSRPFQINYSITEVTIGPFSN
jgi:hypothetical protein